MKDLNHKKSKHNCVGENTLIRALSLSKFISLLMNHLVSEAEVKLRNHQKLNRNCIGETKHFVVYVII